MELDTKSISILNKPRKTVTYPRLLTINHERQKPLFCPKTLARQALELQVFRPESLQQKQVEISELHGEIQSLQTVVGAKSAIESQLLTLKAQLKEANETITRLQSQQKSTSALEVDVDVDSLQTTNESLAAEVSNLQAQLQEFQSGSAKKSKAVANSK